MCHNAIDIVAFGYMYIYIAIDFMQYKAGLTFTHGIAKFTCHALDFIMGGALIDLLYNTSTTFLYGPLGPCMDH